MLNSADYRCRGCGASISEVSGLCGACEPPLPMVDDRDYDCEDGCAYLYGMRPRPCADCVCFDADDEAAP